MRGSAKGWDEMKRVEMKKDKSWNEERRWEEMSWEKLIRSEKKRQEMRKQQVRIDEKSWDQLRRGDKTCRWTEKNQRRNQHVWKHKMRPHEIRCRRSKDCSCNAWGACPHPMGTFCFFALWAFIFEASAPGLPGHYFWRLHPTRIHSPTAASGELETAQLLTEKARAQLQGVRQELSAECAAAKAGE